MPKRPRDHDQQEVRFVLSPPPPPPRFLIVQGLPLVSDHVGQTWWRMNPPPLPMTTANQRTLDRRMRRRKAQARAMAMTRAPTAGHDSATADGHSSAEEEEEGEKEEGEEEEPYLQEEEQEQAANREEEEKDEEQVEEEQVVEVRSEGGEVKEGATEGDVRESWGVEGVEEESGVEEEDQGGVEERGMEEEKERWVDEEEEEEELETMEGPWDMLDEEESWGDWPMEQQDPGREGEPMPPMPPAHAPMRDGLPAHAPMRPMQPEHAPMRPRPPAHAPRHLYRFSYNEGTSVDEWPWALEQVRGHNAVPLGPAEEDAIMSMAHLRHLCLSSLPSRLRMPMENPDILINCRQIEDVDHFRSQHLGMHADHIRTFLRSSNLPYIFACLWRRLMALVANGNGLLHVHFVCTRGRHRSVALQAMFHAFVARFLPHVHVECTCFGDWGRGSCGLCPECLVPWTAEMHIGALRVVKAGLNMAYGGHAPPY